MKQLSVSYIRGGYILQKYECGEPVGYGIFRSREEKISIRAACSQLGYKWPMLLGGTPLPTPSGSEGRPDLMLNAYAPITDSSTGVAL